MRNRSLPNRRRPARRLISRLACVAAVALVAACGSAPAPTGKSAQSAQPTRQGATALAAPVGQTLLPFEGLHHPNGVAVDTDGNAYLADRENHRVLKMPAGSSSQIVLPFPATTRTSPGPLGEDEGLVYPAAIAVDKHGNLYVTDCDYPGRVWELEAGSSTAKVLLNGWGGEGLAVDLAGNLYGTQLVPSQVWKLAAGSNTPTVLPFVGLPWPIVGVAVDTEGNVYVSNSPHSQSGKTGEHRVVKLSADLTTQTDVPFTGLDFPQGMAVDSTGTLYVTDGDVPSDVPPEPGVSSRVLKLTNGSSAQTVLPFTGLHNAYYVAVRPIWMAGPTDTVYLSDTLNDRVLRLGLGSAP